MPKQRSFIMKHDCCKLATSAGVAIAIAYTVCALFVHARPEVALNLMAQMMHLTSIEPLAHYLPFMHVTAANFISGIAQSFAYIFGVVWLACQAHHHMFNRK